MPTLGPQEPRAQEDDAPLTAEELGYRRQRFLSWRKILFWGVVLCCCAAWHQLVHLPNEFHTLRIHEPQASQKHTPDAPYLAAEERRLSWKPLRDAWDGYERCVLGSHRNLDNRVTGLFAASLETGQNVDLVLRRCRERLDGALSDWSVPAGGDGALKDAIKVQRERLVALPRMIKGGGKRPSEASLTAVCQNMQRAAQATGEVFKAAEQSDLSPTVPQCNPLPNPEGVVVEPSVPWRLRHVGVEDLEWSNQNPQEVWQMQTGRGVGHNTHIQGPWLMTRAINDKTDERVWLRTRDGQNWEQITAKVGQKDGFRGTFDWKDDGSLWTVRHREGSTVEELMLKAPGKEWAVVAPLPAHFQASHVKHLPDLNQVALLGAMKTGGQDLVVAVRVSLDSAQVDAWRLLAERSYGEGSRPWYRIAQARIEADGRATVVITHTNKVQFVRVFELSPDWDKPPVMSEDFDGSYYTDEAMACAGQGWGFVFASVHAQKTTAQASWLNACKSRKDCAGHFKGRPFKVSCLQNRRFVLGADRPWGARTHRWRLDVLGPEDRHLNLLKVHIGESDSVLLNHDDPADLKALSLHHDHAVIWSCGDGSKRCQFGKRIQYNKDTPHLELDAVFADGLLFSNQHSSRWF